MLLIEQNPAAPSLHTHRLKGPFSCCSASRLSREYRIVFVLGTDRVTFIDIGTHDDVYRLFDRDAECKLTPTTTP